MKIITQIFKALSDPTRLRILWLLQAEAELCVCDCMEVLALPQSTVSRHLSYLRNAGLVDGERKGVWMYYRLTEEVTQFSGDVLTLLQTAAIQSQQAWQDQKKLKHYLKNKKKDACEKAN